MNDELLDKGKVYMWGKNSHVISGQVSGEYIFYSPHIIDTKGSAICSVSCGPWHVLAIPGHPGILKNKFSNRDVNGLKILDWACSSSFWLVWVANVIILVVFSNWNNFYTGTRNTFENEWHRKSLLNSWESWKYLKTDTHIL